MVEENKSNAQDIRIRSIRCSEAVIDAIKKICDENGQTQAEALNQMLNAWEYVQSTSLPALADRQESISRFTGLVNSVQTMYLELLKDMTDVKERTAEEFQRRLDNKDAKLFEAEEQLKKQKSIADSYVSKYKEASDTAEECLEKYRILTKELDEYKKMAEGRMKDKDLVIESLHKKVEELSEFEGLKDENEKLKAENSYFKKQIAEIKEILEKVKDDSRLEMERALVAQETELTKKHLMELSEIQEHFMKRHNA